MGYYYNDYPPYESVDSKKGKALKVIEKLKKKGRNISPVHAKGSGKLTKSWWATSWIKNLESYADLSNRIGRGRAYARNGFVIDLQIKKGKVTAMVTGSSNSIYNIEVDITALAKAKKKSLLELISGKIGSIQELIDGKFPALLKENMLDHQTGLFPSSKEIQFSCDCPDSAHMCKHIAATLFGIGIRFDEEASLFFELRDINMSDLIVHAVQERKDDILHLAKKYKGKNIIKEKDTSLEKLFDIDFL